MAIVAPGNLQLKLHRWMVWTISTYLMHKLKVKDYIIAGSYRRGKLWSNDIDILIPEAYVDQQFKVKMKKLGWHFNTLRNSSQCYSQQYIKIIRLLGYKKAIVLDIMPYDNTNIGNALLYATGSAQHNDIIRAILRSRGYTWSNPRFFKNLLTNECISFKDEKAAADFVGIQYKKPGDR